MNANTKLLRAITPHASKSLMLGETEQFSVEQRGVSEPFGVHGRIRVALVGSYVPRKCGIATFTEDVHRSLSALRSVDIVDVFAMGDGGSYEYPTEVAYEICKTPASYHEAALKINAGHYDVVFIQHEFGLFGGDAGNMLFELFDRIPVPIVTMLHTVLKTPNTTQLSVLKRISNRSHRLITMSQRGSDFLKDVYDVTCEKIDVIPHGIPNTPQRDLDRNKQQFGLAGKQVALTFGLIGPGKGLEYAIDAMPSIVKDNPNFIYVLLGATHPNLIAEEGEKYRDALMTQAEKLGVESHLRFENRFVEIEELTRWIGAADIYLTPYLNEAQITSGTLSYAYGCGTPVISTPYWHASDLLSKGRGCLVPFRDSVSIAEQVNSLLRDTQRRESMAENAYVHGRTMIWPAVASRLAEVLRSCVIDGREQASQNRSHQELGSNAECLTSNINLNHLIRLTDDTGVIQHATCLLPNRHEGYCVDDNARALLLSLALERLGVDDAQICSLQTRYAEFVNHAIDEPTGCVRNFMGYDRRWLEDLGSNDSIGRTCWVLGSCVGQTRHQSLRLWATRMFMPVLRSVSSTNSLRAWCFGLLGVCEYQHTDSGNTEINQIGRDLLARIALRLNQSRTTNWPWFEDRLTYDNAKIPHAMLAGSIRFGVPHWRRQALESLDWLCQLQRGPGGCFLPIGSDQFYVRNGVRSLFDQQPIEAWASISAYLAAYKLTRDAKWYLEAERAFGWFFGRNIVGQRMIDDVTGGCYDGLHDDRVNQNQGAESTLSWLLASAEMRLVVPIPQDMIAVQRG